MTYNAVRSIVPLFCFEGTFHSVEEITSGNIHSTYHLIYMYEGQKKEYLLQRFNQYVFKNPQKVAQNIRLVTSHLSDTLRAMGMDPSRRVQMSIPTVDGNWLAFDRDGQCWRAGTFISDATAYDRVEKPEHFYEVGRIFGEFQYLLRDFDATQLYEPLPDFHNTAARYLSFEKAVENDLAGCAASIEKEIEFFRARRDKMGLIVQHLTDGTLPTRVTHNDTKINNVMIDNATDKAICVIDLDTVMPGSSLYDFGDAVRFGASTGEEDEQDLSRVSLDLDLFTLFAKGFMSEGRHFLTQNEIRLLPLGVWTITCELAMRFLTDYLDGDLYFKTRYPQHNLVRTHAQMRLLEDIEAKYQEMERIILSL